jgi:parvulin-like peptidyl-prolyl isomerase
MDQTKKRNLIILALASLILILLLAFLYTKENKQESKMIAKINNKAYYEQDLKNFLGQRFNIHSFNFDAIPENQKKSILVQIATEKLINKKAAQSSITKSQEVKTKLKAANNLILREAFLKSIGQKAATLEKIKVKYQEKAAKLEKDLTGKEEISVSHILVKEKASADAVIQKLYKSSFEDVAKAESLDKHSAERGGYLGYFTKGQMVKEFEQAAFKLKKKQISKPVKTSFGWHIIRMEDKRPAQVPTMQALYTSIEEELSNQAIEKYLSDIRNETSVEIISYNSNEGASNAPAAATSEN